MKTFNITGTCRPKEHYMVNIDRQVEAAAQLVRQGKYFCINRGRQYGKTTTLAALTRYLSKDNLVFSISFEGTGDRAFANAESASAEFLNYLQLESTVNGSSKEMQAFLEQINLQTGYLLSFCFNKTKTSGLQPPMQLNGRTLIEAIV